MNAVFWYTGATIWWVIAIILGIGVLLAVIVGIVTAYFRASQWFSIYLLCRWTKTPMSQRAELYEGLRMFAMKWSHAGYTNGKASLTGERLVRCLDYLGYYLLHQYREEKRNERVQS